MARTTNEFGGGEIVPSIEAITGIQAPVQAEFVNSRSTAGTNPTLNAADIVALQAITVMNEHSEPRSLQNPKNNLKNSSGIERIRFNGIRELETEAGASAATARSIIGGSAFGTASTTAVVNITNSNGASGAVTLTFTPAANTAVAYAAAFVAAYNLSTNLRLAEYTAGIATINTNTITLHADQAGSDFDLNILTIAPAIGTVTATTTTANSIDDALTYALDTGDSRIRFVGAGWIQNANNDGNDIRTDILGEYIEITFFGTGLNLLGRMDSNSDWEAVVDGGAPRNILPITGTIATNVYNGNRFRPNTIIPVVQDLTAGIHTVRISRSNANTLFLNGCEIVNENPLIPSTTTPAIATQPGADFDGRVSVVATNAANNLPIEPTVASAGTAYRVNSGDTKRGARVLNYATSGGQLKQSFTEVIESVVEAGGAGTTYTVQLSTPGTTGTLTIPAAAETIRVITFGGGGSGGNVGGGGSGGGGGGGARAEVVYRRDVGNTATLALTSSIGAANGTTTASLAGTQVVAAGGGSSANGFSAGPGGTPSIPGTDPGITGWTRQSTTEFNGSAGNTASGGAGAEAGGVGGNTGGGLAGRRGLTPLFPLTLISEIAGRAEGSGGGQTSVGDPLSTVQGAIPGGGGSGNTANNNPIQGTGARGETYIIYTLATAVDPTTNGTFTTATAQLIGTPIQALEDTNHGTQEVVRRINWREFGRGTTEFSSGTASQAFTLDDGTTCLISGSQVTFGTVGIRGGEVLSLGNVTNPTQAMVRLTFVGTGLDVRYRRDGSANASPITVHVDGYSIGTFQPFDGEDGIRPIVSGLAYGTHTVCFEALQSSGSNHGIVDFIIYGPRKPEIPSEDAGSVELSEYNIMSDFAETVGSTNNIIDLLRIGKGTLRKMTTREMLFQGAWGNGGNAGTFEVNSINGKQITTQNGNEPMIYSFYGTGLEFRFSQAASSSLQFFIDQDMRPGATATPLTLRKDGSNNGLDFFSPGAGQTFIVQDAPATTVGAVGSTATVPATTDGLVVITGSGTLDNSGFRVTDLPLGFHTFAVMPRSGGSSFRPRSIDVITPIHISEDSLNVGSLALKDLRLDPIFEEDVQVTNANLGEAKAWLNYDPSAGTITGNIISSSNIAAVVQGSQSNIQVYLDTPFKDDGYVILATARDDGSGTNISVQQNTGAIRPRPGNFNLNSDESPTAGFYVACFGELIDE